MKKLFYTQLVGDESVLPDDFQGALDNLNSTSKVIPVEEYFNDTMSIFIAADGVYLFRTKEVERQQGDGSKYYTVDCTLSKAKDIDDLYNTLRDKRYGMDIEDVKAVIQEVKLTMQGN